MCAQDHIHSDAQGGQRRALMEGCEPPCGRKKPNLGPLGKQQSLLTSKPSRQPQNVGLKDGRGVQ